MFYYWKLITAKKLLYLPRILSTKEKGILLTLFMVALISGFFLFGRVYLHITTPVPAIAGSYTEGILGEPRVINPIFASRDAERDIVRLVYAGLVSYDSDGNIVNDLAERHSVSDDGKTYTLILRKNIFWHDNVPLTTDDIAYTIRTIQNTQYKSPLRPNWQGVSIEIVDLHTIRFILRVPYAPFLENLTVGIIPKHIWEKITPAEAPLHELNLKPIGSGPYRFDQIKQQKDGSIEWLRLTRNTRYYRAGPNLKQITFVFFHSEDDMITGIRTGKIDGYGPISEKFASHINKNNATIHAIEMPRLFGIFFNQQKAPALQSSAVRRAINLALNRDEISKNVTFGGAFPHAYPLPSFLNLHNENVPEHAFDIEETKQLLDKDGWTDANGDGIREKTIKGTKGKPGSRTELKFTLATSDWPDLLHSAEIIRDDLRIAGVGVTIEAYPFNDLEAQVIRPRNFEMLLFGEVYGYIPDPFPFWHSTQIKDPGLNVALYANKKVDRALEEARKTNDNEIRRRRYKDFEEEIMHDIPAVFLYSQTFFYLLPNDMQGVDLKKISLPSDRFNSIDRWYRYTKRIFK